MTVFEVSQQMGIAYCNKFLYKVGQQVAARYHQRHYVDARATKTQNEYGKDFFVYDYPDSFTGDIKLVIEQSLTPKV